MQFCNDCGSAMVKVDGEWLCQSCDAEKIEASNDSSGHRTPRRRSAKLEELPTTDSGSVRKEHSMDWLDSLSEPTDKQIQNAFLPKPSGFSGSTFPTTISNVRITGDPKFVETIAALLKPIQQLENRRTRVEMNLQKTEDKETSELTGNYALYLSVAERG